MRKRGEVREENCMERDGKKRMKCREEVKCREEYDRNEVKSDDLEGKFTLKKINLHNFSSIPDDGSMDE